ncbi:hypothetical protein E3A20_06570, partial [Planctomyces bekefii]
MADQAHKPRGRRAYWIADAVDQLMSERAKQLHAQGIEVTFFTSLDKLLKAFDVRRPSILVVTNDADESKGEKILIHLTSMPEIQGIKLVLVAHRNSSWLTFLAAATNARDIIPRDLPDSAWITRFLFATAPKAQEFVQPHGQITLNSMAQVAVPARITWIRRDSMRIESRVRPATGATLTVTGPLADALGLPSISLKVRKVEHEKLLYRFSDAVTADWKVPDDLQSKADEFLRGQLVHSPKSRLRLFVAVQSTALRSDILTVFSDPRFDISVALQKQNLVDDPKFFTPDLVLVEGKLTDGDDLSRFYEMLEILPPHANVIIIGEAPALAAIKEKHPRRKISLVANLSPEWVAKITARFTIDATNQDASTNEMTAHLLPDNPFSLAEIIMPARVQKTHPLAVQIATPLPVSNFGLCRLDSPLFRKVLGRSPYLKMTATRVDKNSLGSKFIFLAECYLADVDQQDRAKLGENFARMLVDSYRKLELHPASSPRSTDAKELKDP